MNYKILLSKLKSNKLRTFLQLSIICISMIFCLCIFFIYSNVEKYLIEKKVGDLQVGEFEITNINGGEKISQADIKKIENFGIQPQLIYAMNLPSSLQINAFGNSIETDMIIYGVTKELLSGNTYLPIGISSSLLDLYNTQIAGSNYPYLSKELLQTLNINILFGKSQIFETKNISILSGKISTFSSKLPLAGISIPLEVMNQISSGFSNTPSVVKIIGKSDGEKFSQLKTAFSGFNISSQQEKLEGVKDSLEGVRKTLTWIVSLVIGFLIFVLTYSIFSQKNENDKLFFIFRLHGARSNQLFRIIAGEIIIYILVASLIIFLINSLLSSNFFDQKFFQQSRIQYDIQALSIKNLIYIILFHFVVLISIGFLVNYKSILKKFEN